MVLDYSVPGEVTIDMVDYTSKVVEKFEEQIGKIKVAKTPAADHLFQVCENGVKLDKNKAMIFHNATAKALYLCKKIHARSADSSVIPDNKSQGT